MRIWKVNSTTWAARQRRGATEFYVTAATRDGAMNALIDLL